MCAVRTSSLFSFLASRFRFAFAALSLRSAALLCAPMSVGWCDCQWLLLLFGCARNSNTHLKLIDLNLRSLKLLRKKSKLVTWRLVNTEHKSMWFTTHKRIFFASSDLEFEMWMTVTLHFAHSRRHFVRFIEAKVIAADRLLSLSFVFVFFRFFFWNKNYRKNASRF